MKNKSPLWARNMIKWIQDFDCNSRSYPQILMKGIKPRQPKFRILSFLEAGKYVRKISGYLGKDYINYTTTFSGTHLPYRAVCWSFKWADIKKLKRKLKQAGVKDYMLVLVTPGMMSSGYLFIRIPAFAYVSSFKKSDDPKEWMKRQKKREKAITERKKINQVLEKLDRGVKEENDLG